MQMLSTSVGSLSFRVGDSGDMSFRVRWPFDVTETTPREAAECLFLMRYTYNIRNLNSESDEYGILFYLNDVPTFLAEYKVRRTLDNIYD